MSFLKLGEQMFRLNLYPSLLGLNLTGWQMPQNPAETLMRREELWRRLKQLTTLQDLEWIEQDLKEQQEAVGIFPKVSLKDNSFLNLCNQAYLNKASNNGMAVNQLTELEEMFRTGQPKFTLIPPSEAEEILEDAAGNLSDQLLNLMPEPVL